MEAKADDKITFEENAKQNKFAGTNALKGWLY
jgi:hypothetical protein